MGKGLYCPASFQVLFIFTEEKVAPIHMFLGEINMVHMISIGKITHLANFGWVRKATEAQTA